MVPGVPGTFSKGGTVLVGSCGVTPGATGVVPGKAGIVPGNAGTSPGAVAAGGILLLSKLAPRWIGKGSRRRKASIPLVAGRKRLLKFAVTLLPVKRFVRPKLVGGTGLVPLLGATGNRGGGS